jgi:hypothetical protein
MGGADELNESVFANCISRENVNGEMQDWPFTDDDCFSTVGFAVSWIASHFCGTCIFIFNFSL